MKASASVSLNRGSFKSAPRTQKPSRFNRLMRWLPMNPPAPHTSALFIPFSFPRPRLQVIVIYPDTSFLPLGTSAQGSRWLANISERPRRLHGHMARAFALCKAYEHPKRRCRHKGSAAQTVWRHVLWTAGHILRTDQTALSDARPG